MDIKPTRRQFLLGGLACAGTLITPKLAQAILPTPKVFGCTRKLVMHHIHTGEKIEIPYWKEGQYCKKTLVALNHFMRDWRRDQEHPINPQLLDLMHKLAADTGKSDQAFNIICGYRSPKTNASLRQGSTKVAKNSKHMSGQAIDLNLEGTKLADLRDAARAHEAGGVGYYPKSNFIHIDIRDKPAYWT